jgi:hypothetical protein
MPDRDADRRRPLRRVTELLVPQGTLLVEQVYQEIIDEWSDGPVMWLETLRTPRLNGELIWWRPDTRDLLAAADDALALLPPPPGQLAGPGQ